MKTARTLFVALALVSLGTASRAQAPSHNYLDYFCAFVENTDMCPAPPETIDVRYWDFDPDRWLEIPATGTGPNSLQPLPRHWTYWSGIVRHRLRHGPKSVFRHLYSTASELATPPWADDDAHHYLS